MFLFHYTNLVEMHCEILGYVNFVLHLHVSIMWNRVAKVWALPLVCPPITN
jgi:hypothetical protein